MMSFILRLLGWRLFKYNGVSIYQRRCLVDQSAVAKALDDTSNKRSWCPDSKLSIFIEPNEFTGIYGTIQNVEVTRFAGIFSRTRSANIRFAAGSVKYQRVVDAIMEIERDGKSRN
tara:strand:- start:1995 stop:2342 length:348 start_codon:yes stop_codon:yes gene_type:complete